MHKANFQLKTIHNHPLMEDGLSICEAVSAESSVNSLQDLENILTLGNLQTIILIQRNSISQTFMNEVAKDAFDGHEPKPSDWHNQWNESGGAIATNAMPHIHDYSNCHAAPQSSECSTAFYVREAVIEVVRELACNRRYPIDLRRQLDNALVSVEEESIDAFFEALHAIHPTREGWLPVLTCVQEMQNRIQALGGMYEVNRGNDGYGLVAIPALSVHGRTAINHMIRSERTAWRYFGKAVDNKS